MCSPLQWCSTRLALFFLLLCLLLLSFCWYLFNTGPWIFTRISTQVSKVHFRLPATPVLWCYSASCKCSLITRKLLCNYSSRAKIIVLFKESNTTDLLWVPAASVSVCISLITVSKWPETKGRSTETHRSWDQRTWKNPAQSQG